jgi:hypothetical protein
MCARTSLCVCVPDIEASIISIVVCANVLILHHESICEFVSVF